MFWCDLAIFYFFILYPLLAAVTEKADWEDDEMDFSAPIVFGDGTVVETVDTEEDAETQRKAVEDEARKRGEEIRAKLALERKEREIADKQAAWEQWHYQQQQLAQHSQNRQKPTPGLAIGPDGQKGWAKISAPNPNSVRILKNDGPSTGNMQHMQMQQQQQQQHMQMNNVNMSMQQQQRQSQGHPGMGMVRHGARTC